METRAGVQETLAWSGPGNPAVPRENLGAAGATVWIDARRLSYRRLNSLLREAELNGATRIEIHCAYGQRYIGTNLRSPVRITIRGTPGNDLGAFMDGPLLEVLGNAQDGVGNTMGGGEIVIHGRAGDILGMAMRGGTILVRDDVGYRCAIHMKEYGSVRPLVVIGGTAQDFLGEYMAGGTVVLLGVNLGEGGQHRIPFLGTGMHGGSIFVRGPLAEDCLGREVGISEPRAEDQRLITGAVALFARRFGYEPERLLAGRFVRLYPRHLRPYGNLYAY